MFRGTAPFFLAIGIWLLPLVHSCRPDDGDEPPKFYPADETIRKLFCFKEGSEWIYYDSLNNKEDSIWVKSSSYYKQSVQDVSVFLFEEYTYHAQWHYTEDDRFKTLDYRSGRQYEFNGAKISFINFYKHIDSLGGSVYEKTFVTPINDIVNYGAGFLQHKGLWYSSYIDIMLIGDNFEIGSKIMLAPVYKVFLKGSFCNGFTDIEYTMVEGVGIVEWKQGDRHYKLKSYQVELYE